VSLWHGLASAPVFCICLSTIQLYASPTQGAFIRPFICGNVNLLSQDLVACQANVLEYSGAVYLLIPLQASCGYLLLHMEKIINCSVDVSSARVLAMDLHPKIMPSSLFFFFRHARCCNHDVIQLTRRGYDSDVVYIACKMRAKSEKRNPFLEYGAKQKPILSCEPLHDC